MTAKKQKWFFIFLFYFIIKIDKYINAFSGAAQKHICVTHIYRASMKIARFTQKNNAKIEYNEKNVAIIIIICGY